MEEKKYTGRQIAIFTDSHGLYEPTLAALEDMERRGITEIYSLGDNIGVGPDPDKVIDLLARFNVQSIAGNSEEYVTLGVEPFISYFDEAKMKSQSWTLSKLNEQQIGQINLFPRFIELLVGGKKVALVHFANDVRFDYNRPRNTWSYQANFDFRGDGTRYKSNASDQFNYTNSQAQLEKIESIIKKYGPDSPFIKGYLSAKDDPLFAGKRVDYYDAIVQGHVHWKLYDENEKTQFYSIRAVGIAYRQDPVDSASYVILKEHENGFDLEEVLVTFDREAMIYSIAHSDSPDKTIIKFVCATEEELRKAQFMQRA